MKTNAICPVCQQTVSMVAFLKAPTPFRFSCSHCKSKIKVHLRGLKPTVLLAAAVLLWAFPAMLYVSQTYGLTAAFLLVGTLLPAWVALDLILGLWVFTKGAFSALEPALEEQNKVGE